MNTEDKNRRLTYPAGPGRVEEIYQYLPEGLRRLLSMIARDKLMDVEEIRLRTGKPVVVQKYDEDCFLKPEGGFTVSPQNAYIVTQEEIGKTLEMMSENSIYAFQEEIRNGFITLRGGHRVGIAGRVVMDRGNVKNVKEISGLNIRISRQVIGCSERLYPYMLDSRKRVMNTLIVSPPQCGKTTILRDLAKGLSDGIDHLNFKGVKVGIVDERSEIAASYKGNPQYNIGIRTDVLDGCPKSIGMVMMVRSLSPQVIITDEIGNEGDRDAVMQVINAGVKIIASAHGYNISELKSRKEVLNLIESKVFERYAVLSNRDGPGTLEEIIDGTSMQVLYRSKME